MTVVGAGGVTVRRWKKMKRFHRDYEDLETSMKDLVDSKLQDLVMTPMPPGLRFEKLKGHDNIYTIHANGNYKISMEIAGDLAYLRRVADHDEMDRSP